SALDPVAAEEVLAALSRLVLDSGLTVVLAEHRLERVVQFADRVISLLPPGPEGTSTSGAGVTALSGAPAHVSAASPSRPPVAELGALAGCRPLPMSVREARRSLRELREKVGGVVVPDQPRRAGEVRAEARAVRVTYGDHTALDSADVAVRGGQILAVMG